MILTVTMILEMLLQLASVISDFIQILQTLLNGVDNEGLLVVCCLRLICQEVRVILEAIVITMVMIIIRNDFFTKIKEQRNRTKTMTPKYAGPPLIG